MHPTVLCYRKDRKNSRSERLEEEGEKKGEKRYLLSTYLLSVRERERERSGKRRKVEVVLERKENVANGAYRTLNFKR